MLTFFKAFAAALDEFRRHTTFFLLVISLAALAILGRSWLDARDARIHLEATLAAEQKTIAAATKDQSTRDAQLAQSLAQITAAKQKVQTAQQAAAALEQAIPQLLAAQGSPRGLPSPISIELPQPTQPSSQQQSSPHDSRLASNQTTTSPQAPASGQPLIQAAASPQSSPTGAGNQPSQPSSNSQSTSSTTQPGAAPQSADPHSLSASIKSATSLKYLSDLKSQISNLKLSSGEKSASQEKSPPAGNSSSSAQPPQASAPQSSASAQSASSAHSSSGAAQSSAETRSSSGSPAGNPSSAAQPSTNAAGGAAPPAILRIPQEDLKPLYDAVEDCEACAAKLTAAQGDLNDETTKFNAATAERDAALRAARGTFWTRTRRAAKWFAIGAAAGAILARYH